MITQTHVIDNKAIDITYLEKSFSEQDLATVDDLFPMGIVRRGEEFYPAEGQDEAYVMAISPTDYMVLSE